jgi:hypothetical protein
LEILIYDEIADSIFGLLVYARVQCHFSDFIGILEFRQEFRLEKGVGPSTMAANKQHRVKDDDPLQDFMNDVFKTARRAVRDVRRREKKDELRRAAEERREAEAATAKFKRELALKSRGQLRTPKTASDDGHAIDNTEASLADTTVAPDEDDWNKDVNKLKESLAAFDVSSDGLRVTWHGAEGHKPNDSNGPFSKLASKSAGSLSTSPAKPKSAGGLFPTIKGNQGGLGALSASSNAAVEIARKKRKQELGFDCHHKYDASPLFTEEGKKALEKKGNRTTAREDTMSKAGLGGPHPFHGGGGMVSATDGLKQAILSGKIVSSDGTVVQDLVAELQGPTSWSGKDLGVKYRSELEREAAWAAYVKASKASESVHATQGSFFSTVRLIYINS